MAKRVDNRRFRITVKGKFCVYCGEYASCLDHFPPHCETKFGFLLPACSECNVFAGTEFPYDFSSRCALVIDKIKRKYNRVLSTPEWSNSEMAELQYNLNRKVNAWNELRKIISRRVNWNAISYLACSPITKDFVTFNYELSSTPGKAEFAFNKIIKPYVSSAIRY